jgi:23S rRNA-/tRNA-specific pseudouridylate synthase
MRKIIVSEEEANQRLDKFLLKYYKKCPKSLIYKGIRTNKIKYNQKKPKGNEILQVNDEIQIYYYCTRVISLNISFTSSILFVLPKTQYMSFSIHSFTSGAKLLRVSFVVENSSSLAF